MVWNSYCNEFIISSILNFLFTVNGGSWIFATRKFFVWEINTGLHHLRQPFYAGMEYFHFCIVFLQVRKMVCTFLKNTKEKEIKNISKWCSVDLLIKKRTPSWEIISFLMAGYEIWHTFIVHCRLLFPATLN